MALSPTAAAILAAFGASAITGTVTFGITVYSARKQADRDEAQRVHQRERDRAERENRLSDERRNRLRVGYQAVVYAASTIHAVAKEAQAVWATEPEEERDERLNRALQEATNDLGRAVAGLTLESGAQPVIDELMQLRAAFTGHVWEVGEIRRRDAGLREARSRALELLKEIESRSKEIEDLARGHLAP